MNKKNFLKQHPISFVLVGLNLLFTIFILELMIIMARGSPMIISRSREIINLSSIGSRSCCGFAGFILLIFLGILNYHALKYYKSPEEFYFKEDN